MRRLKHLTNKTLGLTGYEIKKLQKPLDEIETKQASSVKTDEAASTKPDPKDYSTTTVPMEVPCQKVAYYHALNNYIKPGAKILDVGSGLGYGMAIMSVLASEVQGIDVDAMAVKYAENEYLGNNPKIKNIQKYDGYRTPFKDNEFDVVTCIDVLEHVEDYHRFLKELLRISKGCVLISTPNQRPEFTNPDGTPKNYWHLREWKPKELDDILSEHQASVEWFYVDGPFEGPFKVQKKPSKDTLVLMPVLKKNK